MKSIETKETSVSTQLTLFPFKGENTTIPDSVYATISELGMGFTIGEVYNNSCLQYVFHPERKKEIIDVARVCIQSMNKDVVINTKDTIARLKKDSSAWRLIRDIGLPMDFCNMNGDDLSDLVDEIIKVMEETLNDREVEILKMMYIDNVPGTVIAKKLGVSKTRVSQNAAKCRRKLAYSSRSIKIYKIVFQHAQYWKKYMRCRLFAMLGDTIDIGYCGSKMFCILEMLSDIMAYEKCHTEDRLVIVADKIKNFKPYRDAMMTCSFSCVLNKMYDELNTQRQRLDDCTNDDESATIFPEEVHLYSLNLSSRSFNALIRGGVQTLADLISKNQKDLLKMNNIGKRCLEEIIEKVKEYGYEIKP